MRRIKVKALLKISGAILLIESGFFLFCIPVALSYSETVMPFIWSIITCLLPGLLLFFLIPSSIHDKLTTREGYLGVFISWIVLSLTGTLPYFYSGTQTDFFKAVFESVSGFTTTGSTIFSDVESLPRSILFWRSLTHWVGGIGIVLLVIIILPTLKVGGYNLFSLESSLKQKILPKTKSIAYTFLLIYLGISATEFLLLIAGGMNLFDSACITFGTVATGGFSTRNTSLAEYSPYLQYVVAVFMFLAATSFILYYFLLKREYKKIKENDELWFYIFFTTAAVVFITLVLYFKTDRSFGESFRHSFFQVIAQITTTGFATTDYMQWPVAGWAFMFFLLFAGGCTGSTTGGIKMARHFLVLQNMKSVFLKLQHPSAVFPIMLNKRQVPDNVNNMMLLFILIFIVTYIAGVLIMIIAGVPVNEAAAASASAMSNVGPGLGLSGNMGNYAHFNDAALGTMTLLMIIGRLEIYTVFAVFTGSFWKN